MSDEAFDAAVRDGVLQVIQPDARWLSTGWNGGLSRADAAYNVTVPDGWERTDIDAYVGERLDAAGFGPPGPALLTGVAMEHVRGARSGPVVAYVTAGLSNPAALPMQSSDPGPDGPSVDRDVAPGTVNLIVGTVRSPEPGALANLLTVAVEAKTATLLAEAGYPGTTTDAVVVGADPAGEAVSFTGSATPVGAAARACVRDALRASLASRYGGTEDAVPPSVSAAEHGVETTRRADVFRPG